MRDRSDGSDFDNFLGNRRARLHDTRRRAFDQRFDLNGKNSRRPSPRHQHINAKTAALIPAPEKSLLNFPAQYHGAKFRDAASDRPRLAQCVGAVQENVSRHQAWDRQAARAKAFFAGPCLPCSLNWVIPVHPADAREQTVENPGEFLRDRGPRTGLR